jgi:PIN domain nuclease of toxin-antitoxin system
VLEGVVRRSEPVALSAISLLEIAILKSEGKLKLQVTLDEFLDEMQANEVFQILPLSYQVASDVATLGSLRDPADRAIVATARVHKLHLMTSDQRIIESKLVPVIV